MPTYEDLKILQANPLETKIGISQTRVMEFVEKMDGKAYIAFSGGKDSTVLLDLVRRIYPDIPAVFCDTGLEYPEIRDFVKKMENVVWVKPKKNFKQVIEDYGFPVISKEVSNTVDLARGGNQKSMSKLKGTYVSPLHGNISPYQCRKWEFLLRAPFKVSSRCCYWLKKAPLESYSNKEKRRPITGIMADESRLRMQQWQKTGCNLLDSKSPKCNPLAFWTEQDILEYIVRFGIPYSSVYGDIIKENGEWKTTGAKRTGCMYCMFGVHLDKTPNRFQRMARTHPKQYDHCINSLGCGKVLDFIGVDYDPDYEGEQYKLDGF